MKPLRFNSWLLWCLVLLGLCAAVAVVCRAQSPEQTEPEQPATQDEPAFTGVHDPGAESEPPQPTPPQEPVVSQIQPPPPPPPAAAAPAPSPAEPVEHPTIDFEFQGAPITAVLEWYARLTERSIVAAPNLAGVINFRSQTKLTKSEAIQALDSVLAVNGVAALPMGEKFLKVVQIATAKQEGVAVSVGEGRRFPPADTLITQIIPLKHADAAEVVTALQPYLHAYGHLMPLTKSNSILITETAGNLAQMMEIVKYVDQPSALRMETKVYILINAKAGDVVQRLQAIIQETLQVGARAAAPPAPPTPVRRPPAPPPGVAPAPAEESVVEGKVIITPDERTNKIFLLTRPANFAFFDRIIAELDAKVEPDVIIKVIELDYASAEEMASLLNSLITGAAQAVTRRAAAATPGRAPTTPVPPPPTPVAGATPGLEGAGFLQFAEGVRILPDPRTNSLLIMATKEDMERIVELIKSIDTAVAQVLVEVVIAEINLDGKLDVGVEAFKRLFKEDSVVQTGGYRTGQPNAPIDLSSLATNLAPLALSSGLTYFATFQNLKLDMVVRLLATSSKFKVLSTPIIQTLHNQEASIIVGESRPVVTATVADPVGTGVAVRSNVEFKDIAIELKVTPRINPDGYVTMDIEQKINDVGGVVNVNEVEVPIITKREAKSSVTVRDQSTIVLGGLIREDKTLSETKVPILGDIPVLGMLFKGKSTNKGRTELIVFIRPTVLRSDAQAVAEARRRSRMLKAGEELELDKKFEGDGAEGRAAAPAGGGPLSKAQPPTDGADAGTPVAEPQPAKIKALKLHEAEPPPATN